jgi:hypothetical protein
MEDVLDVYQRPYDRDYPVVCMDESSKQLVGEVAGPVPAAPGHPKLVDDEYVRNGVAEIFMEVEPLAGRRHVEITERRTRIDWANQVRAMLEDRYPDAIKVVLVMDNLNTHSVASLYQAFAPDLARRLANRLEIHYTPKHGSWLNVAEIELSCLKRQCLADRIPTLERMTAETSAWELGRNNKSTKVNWQFTTHVGLVRFAAIHRPPTAVSLYAAWHDSLDKQAPNQSLAEHGILLVSTPAVSCGGHE